MSDVLTEETKDFNNMEILTVSTKRLLNAQKKLNKNRKLTV